MQHTKPLFQLSSSLLRNGLFSLGCLDCGSSITHSLLGCFLFPLCSTQLLSQFAQPLLGCRLSLRLGCRRRSSRLRLGCRRCLSRLHCLFHGSCYFLVTLPGRYGCQSCLCLGLCCLRLCLVCLCLGLVCLCLGLCCLRLFSRLPFTLQLSPQPLRLGLGQHKLFVTLILIAVKLVHDRSHYRLVRNICELARIDLDLVSSCLQIQGDLVELPLVHKVSILAVGE